MLIRSCPIQNMRSYPFAGKYSADTQEPTRHHVAQLSCNIWGFLYQHLLFYIRCLPLSAQLLLSLFLSKLVDLFIMLHLTGKTKMFYICSWNFHRPSRDRENHNSRTEKVSGKHRPLEFTALFTVVFQHVAKSLAAPNV